MMVDEQEGCEWMDVSSGTGSPGQTRTKGRKTVVCVCSLAELSLHCIWFSFTCAVALTLLAHRYAFYTVSKNDADVTRYNFNIYQPILLIFDSNVAATVSHQTVIYFPTSIE